MDQNIIVFIIIAAVAILKFILTKKGLPFSTAPFLIPFL